MHSNDNYFVRNTEQILNPGGYFTIKIIFRYNTCKLIQINNFLENVSNFILTEIRPVTLYF